MITEDISEVDAKHYPVKYSVWEYKFPVGDTIEDVRFDDTHIHLDLVDGRILSIPMDWIPPLRDADPAERFKFQISEDRRLVIWDPDESKVNEILRLADYLTTRK